METINDRIEMLINHKFNGNKSQYAKAIGIKPSGISSYLGKERRSMPSVNMIIKTIEITGCDALWLLTGKEGTNHIEVKSIGNQSPAMYHSQISNGNNEVLKERIKSLEALLEEKERLIKVLMGNVKL